MDAGAGAGSSLPLAEARARATAAMTIAFRMIARCCLFVCVLMTALLCY
jgi:hypothetical protein